MTDLAITQEVSAVEDTAGPFRLKCRLAGNTHREKQVEKRQGKDVVVR